MQRQWGQVHEIYEGLSASRFDHGDIPTFIRDPDSTFSAVWDLSQVFLLLYDASDRASFEETVEVLFKSAIFARKDDVDGVTPNIMLGQLAHVGTGVSDLLLDSAQLEHAVELEAPDQQQNASLREWGDASPDAVPGQAPAMTPYASSPAGLYGASPARGGATPRTRARSGSRCARRSCTSRARRCSSAQTKCRG